MSRPGEIQVSAINVMTGSFRCATDYGLLPGLGGEHREVMTTALIVIDVQESFRVRDSWQDASAPDIAERIGLLVEHARATGRQVVWILHTEPGSGTPFDPAQGQVRLIEGLSPAEGEPLLYKTSHNAFTTTNLAQQLTTLGRHGGDRDRHPHRTALRDDGPAGQ